MKIGILGAGSWGTTLAALLCENSHDATLWSNDPRDIENIRRTGRNTVYLPDLPLPADLSVTEDITEVSSGKDILVIATPSQYVRSVLQRIPEKSVGAALIVNVAKGIENRTLLRMSEVVQEVFPSFDRNHYAVLSGPSHAEEVSQKRPTTVVAAASNPRTTSIVISTFMTQSFRVYGSSDVVGVELGGSLKNVIAIGAGICDGSGFGDNTKAALITRGIAEIRRLGDAMDADPHTFAGLSGLGDLIVTTMSRHSRNRYVGEEIGKGRPVRDILANMTMVAEGVDTTRSAHELAQNVGVEMPITHQMYEILFNEKDPILATQELMTREAKHEVWW
ncbi:MAG: NAD(P)-dependent glycerol-3-phosphate dehydrogenase [Bacteroidetes bacterium]|nr:NAD(P)-dependent glycerol-3-phosphate dehydrogenase [Bacteroidota bacterium]